MNFRNCKKNFNEVLRMGKRNALGCFIDKGYGGCDVDRTAAACNGLRKFWGVIRTGSAREN